MSLEAGELWREDSMLLICELDWQLAVNAADGPPDAEWEVPAAVVLKSCEVHPPQQSVM